MGSIVSSAATAKKMRSSVCRVITYTAALLLWRGAASVSSGAQTAAPDPLAGDDRLAVKRSVHSVTAPVRDLLADLTRQSGITFFADEAVMDEPITVIAHDQPLSETLRQLSVLGGYAWTRTGSGKSAAYTLRLTEEARKEEEQTHARRLSDAVERILRENEEFFRVAAISEDRRQALAAELPTRLATETDPVQMEKLRTTYAVLMEQIDPSARRPWAPAVRSLLRTLPREDVSSILNGGTTYYSWPRLPGCRQFPAASLEEFEQVGRVDLGISGGFRGEIVAVRIRFTGVGGRQPYLNWHLNVGQRTSQFQTTTGFMGSIPSAWALSAAQTGPAAVPATESWKTDTDLTAVASLAITAAPPSRLDAKSPVHRLGEALDILDRAHPINVVADGFWSANLPGFNAVDSPIGEIIDRLARMTGREWHKAGTFILMKSRDFFTDREAEPPATNVRRWADAANRSFFSLEDLAEIASLPDPQLSTLQEMAIRGDFPVLYSPLHHARAHLRLWAALSAAQRQKAQTAGLSFKDLDADLRMRFILAATDPAARQLSNAPADEEQLAGSRLRIARFEEVQWKVRGGGASASWHVPRVDSDNQPVSREEALKRFKQLDETIKLEDVLPMVKTGITFSYESDKGAIATTWIELPARWESGGGARSGTR